MFRRFSINFALLSMGLDAAIIGLALAASARLRPALGFLPFAAEYPEFIPTPWLVFPIFAVQWTAALLLFNVYDGRRNLRPFDEFASLTLGSLLATVAMAGTLYLTFRQVSRLLFLIFVITGYLGMLAWRTAARYYLQRSRRQPEKRRQVLIIGAGPVGRELQRQILANPELGLNVAGLLDDNPAARQDAPDVLGPVVTMESWIEKLHIDDVVIALPQRAYRRMNRLVGDLHHLPVKVWIIPDYFRLALHKAAIEQFAGIPMLDLRAPALSDSQRMVKRAFDLLATLALLPLLLPLMGLIALAIRLDSPGPALFRQARAGENGRIFTMLKFRTMRADAEALRSLVEQVGSDGNLIHKTAADPRITRLGRILRRASLDEMPQLFNIVKGEMSLVGPRPELPHLVAQYQPWQRQRFAIPQGLTGWWQINGRSDRPMHLNTEDDLYYVQNYSLLLDIYILLKTPWVVLSGKGAF